MSDSKNNPKPLPPDDFSATTPNIKMPKPDQPGFKAEPSNDWEKTNYNYSPKDLKADEWNKTAYNVPKATPNHPADFNKPAFPHQPPANAPKQDEWGMTQANINIPFNQPTRQEESVREELGSRQADYGATTPFINLPANERAKYQNPSAAKAKIDDKKEEEEKKPAGIPGWLWALGGLLAMFLFALVVLLGVYFFFFNKTGFEVVLKGAPPRSDVKIDGSNWGVSSDDGTTRLPGLRAGTKKIDIIHPNFKCETQDITGADGERKEMIARCSNISSTGFEVSLKNAPPKSEVFVDGTSIGVTGDDGTLKLQGLSAGSKKVEVRNANFKCDVQDIAGINGEKKELTARCNSATVPNDCLQIKPGEYEKAAKCAYDELDKLEKTEKAGTMYTVVQLLAAMNLYVVNFDSGKFNIKPKDMKFIERASGFIKKLPPNTIIEVGGHTDAKGTDAKNQPLSENRAKAVQQSLLQFGITSSMLLVKGYGSKMPKETNDTEEGRFRNRRIEYTVSK